MAESQKGRIAALAAVSEHLQLLPWAARAQGLSISKAGDSAAFLLRSLTTFMAKKNQLLLMINGISCISVCALMHNDLRSLGGTLQQALPLWTRGLLAA